MIELTKKYKTRDGREVQIHAIDGPKPDEPVIASIKTGTAWFVFTWPANGSSYDGIPDSSDLIEVVPRWEGEIWVHANGDVRRGIYWKTESETTMAIEAGWRKITAIEKEAT